MKLLLDVSALVALLWKTHVHHQRAVAWRKDKTIALCPITELGFIRVCTSPAYNLAMNDARKLLSDFIHDEKLQFIPAGTRTLDGVPAPSSSKSTDWYWANLAGAHGMKLATGCCSIPSASVRSSERYHLARHSFCRRLFRRKYDVNKQSSSRHRLPI